MKRLFIISATFDLNEIKDNIENNQENQDSIPITVILDNVRTPDNVGALIRVAAAVGCKQILAMKVNDNRRQISSEKWPVL
jgi:tRNA G18 (ribose-2'-O)-methylase SpoU